MTCRLSIKHSLARSKQIGLPLRRCTQTCQSCSPHSHNKGWNPGVRVGWGSSLTVTWPTVPSIRRYCRKALCHTQNAGDIRNSSRAISQVHAKQRSTTRSRLGATPPFSVCGLVSILLSDDGTRGICVPCGSMHIEDTSEHHRLDDAHRQTSGKP